MSNDSATSANQASISDGDDGRHQAFLTRHHAGGERDTGPNQDIIANRNILLVEYRGRLPHNHAALTKCGEFLAT
jgi:hypothetical protein